MQHKKCTPMFDLVPCCQVSRYSVPRFQSPPPWAVDLSYNKSTTNRSNGVWAIGQTGECSSYCVSWMRRLRKLEAARRPGYPQRDMRSLSSLD